MTGQWPMEIIMKLHILGISQKEFAKACGYSEPYTSQVLRGKKDTPPARRIMRDVIKRLAKEHNDRAGVNMP